MQDKSPDNEQSMSGNDQARKVLKNHEAKEDSRQVSRHSRGDKNDLINDAVRKHVFRGCCSA